jgi:hypothetical protein
MPSDPDEFVAQPICKVGTEDSFMNDVMSVCGISPKDMVYSNMFEQVIRQHLAEDIKYYLKLITDASTTEENMLRHILINEAEKYLEEMFSKSLAFADQVKKSLSHNQTNTRTVPDVSTPSFIPIVVADFQRYPPVITGGTSCPTAGLWGGISDSMTIAEIGGKSSWQGLFNGGQLPSIFEGSKKVLKCKCPFCNKENVGAIIAGGKITCPSCKKSVPYSC